MTTETTTEARLASKIARLCDLLEQAHAEGGSAKVAAYHSGRSIGQELVTLGLATVDLTDQLRATFVLTLAGHQLAAALTAASQPASKRGPGCPGASGSGPGFGKAGFTLTRRMLMAGLMRLFVGTKTCFLQMETPIADPLPIMHSVLDQLATLPCWLDVSLVQFTWEYVVLQVELWDGGPSAADVEAMVDAAGFTRLMLRRPPTLGSAGKLQLR